jgi:cytochrome c oxidase cbb3-type subunit 1
MHPYYVIRALGGVLFLIGGIVMAYNFWRTIRGDVRQEVRETSLAAPVAAE